MKFKNNFKCVRSMKPAVNLKNITVNLKIGLIPVFRKL